MQLEKELKDILIKKAMGYTVEESVKEYSVDEDGEKLLKKKVNTKYYPPDLTALNILLSNSTTDYKSLSDEALEKEKENLLNLLKELEDGDKKSK